MDHLLPLLIESSQTERDHASIALRKALQALKQATDTQERLRVFRMDCLARSPAGSLGRGDAQSLEDYQRFVTRLDEAIAMQEQQVQMCQTRADRAQEGVLYWQRRALAFETLVKRRAAAKDKAAARVAQREADEFAARAFARNNNSSSIFRT